MRLAQSINPLPFTENELETGRAIRFVFVSKDEAWRNSVCLDCDLPLPFHPAGRKKRSRPSYCKVAQREMLRMLDDKPSEPPC